LKNVFWYHTIPRKQYRPMNDTDTFNKAKEAKADELFIAVISYHRFSEIISRVFYFEWLPTSHIVVFLSILSISSTMGLQKRQGILSSFALIVPQRKRIVVDNDKSRQNLYSHMQSEHPGFLLSFKSDFNQGKTGNKRKLLEIETGRKFQPSSYIIRVFTIET
jgi:hypothetical protein